MQRIDVSTKRRDRGGSEPGYVCIYCKVIASGQRVRGVVTRSLGAWLTRGKDPGVKQA